MTVPQELTDTCGWLAAICFAVLLAPQIVLNQRRRSTQGFSLSLVHLWHLAAILYVPYLLHNHQPFVLVVQWSIFCLGSIILEAQFVIFHPTRKSTLYVILCIMSTVGISIALTIALDYLFQGTGDTQAGSWVPGVVGSDLSSAMLALGFLPQVMLMCREKSSAGFSMGLTALDLTGSILSILTLTLGGHLDVGAVIPYAVIVGFQIFMIFLAFIVFPEPGRLENVCKFRRRGEEAREGEIGSGAEEKMESTGSLDGRCELIEHERRGWGERSMVENAT